MGKKDNISDLKKTTYKELDDMKTKDLRNFVARMSKSVYDQFRKTEKYIEEHPEIHSKFVEDRNKEDGVQKQWRVRRIGKNSKQLKEMTRRDLMREIKNMKQAVNSKTFSIEGAIKYTEYLKAKGIEYEKLKKLSSEEWHEIRSQMEIYGSETELVALAEANYNYSKAQAILDTQELKLVLQPIEATVDLTGDKVDFGDYEDDLVPIEDYTLNDLK